MTAQPSPDMNIGGAAIAGLMRFSHRAMATDFEVLILHKDSDYALQAACAAFDKVDELEAELSRFIPNSDISRINNLTAGKSVVISPDTFRCLKLCKCMYERTSGAFDVTIGSLVSCWFNIDKTMRSPTTAELDRAQRCTGLHLVELNEKNHTVKLKAAPIKLDLGGIGKGFAVDKMMDVLRDWEITTALAHGGSSSVSAVGLPDSQKGWPLTITDPEDTNEILEHFHLTNAALSASGLRKGRHIIDPKTGQPIKIETKIAAWVSTPSAAVSDALSTAFMIMSPEDTKHYCLKYTDTSALIISRRKKANSTEKKEIVRLGSLWR